MDIMNSNSLTFTDRYGVSHTVHREPNGQLPPVVRLFNAKFGYAFSFWYDPALKSYCEYVEDIASSG